MLIAGSLLAITTIAITESLLMLFRCAVPAIRSVAQHLICTAFTWNKHEFFPLPRTVYGRTLRGFFIPVLQPALDRLKPEVKF